MRYFVFDDSGSFEEADETIFEADDGRSAWIRRRGQRLGGRTIHHPARIDNDCRA